MDFSITHRNLELLQVSKLVFLYQHKYSFIDKYDHCQPITEVVDSESGFLIGQPAGIFTLIVHLINLLPCKCFSAHHLIHTKKNGEIFSLSVDSYYFFLKYRKSPSNPRRYRKQVICGYSVPTLFLTMTGIAEASLSQCSRFRPRFNEQSCFFSGIFAFKNCSFDFQIAINFIFFFLD